MWVFEGFYVNACEVFYACYVSQNTLFVQSKVRFRGRFESRLWSRVLGCFRSTFELFERDAIR